MSSSAAHPDALLTYASRTGPFVDAAERQVVGIDGQLQALRASSGGYLPLVSSHGFEHDLRSELLGVRTIDQRVAEIGRAFLDADEAGTAVGDVVTVADARLVRSSAGAITWLRQFSLAELAHFWHGDVNGVPAGESLVALEDGRGIVKLWKAHHAARSAEGIAFYKAWSLSGTSHTLMPTFNNSPTGRLLTALASGRPLRPLGRVVQLAPARHVATLEAVGAHTQSFSVWMNQPSTTTLFRKVGVVGGAASTVADARVLMDHGDPRKAFEREGAGYVADLARGGFSASNTAFLLAPTPVTGAFVIGTGVVWAGAEVWDNWDEISSFVDTTWDAGLERLPAVVDGGRRMVADLSRLGDRLGR